MAELAYNFHHDAARVPWPKQGSWTWDDYLRLPDDGQRYEIIHGVLYGSPAPPFIHQVAVTRLAHFLSQFVLSRHLGMVLVAPLDVLLPGIAEPVQPDVLVLKNENLPDVAEAMNFQGVPDFVAEVLSPSSKRLDQKVKFRAYEEAGRNTGSSIRSSRPSWSTVSMSPAANTKRRNASEPTRWSAPQCSRDSS